ncbi:MAG: hypothetical protein HMLKMBBP_03655 [Planctomycetes bacterium]|nr:hypothetical protein [Planctomycetota bacterium]
MEVNVALMARCCESGEEALSSFREPSPLARADRHSQQWASTSQAGEQAFHPLLAELIHAHMGVGSATWTKLPCNHPPVVPDDRNLILKRENIWAATSNKVTHDRSVIPLTGLALGV